MAHLYHFVSSVILLKGKQILTKFWLFLSKFFIRVLKFQKGLQVWKDTKFWWYICFIEGFADLFWSENFERVTNFWRSSSTEEKRWEHRECTTHFFCWQTSTEEIMVIIISMMVVGLHTVGGSLLSDQFPLWRALLSGHPSLFFVFPFDVNNLSILYYFLLFKSIYSFL